jgi:predicted RNA binding protein YcfA (HicA-like mRNA interferase family)
LARLPRLSGKEVIKALGKAGFVPVRQKGSHVFMRKEILGKKITTVVPVHNEIDVGTLLEIIRQCKMTRDEFLDLL